MILLGLWGILQAFRMRQESSQKLLNGLNSSEGSESHDTELAGVADPGTELHNEDTSHKENECKSCTISAQVI